MILTFVVIFLQQTKENEMILTFVVIFYVPIYVKKDKTNSNASLTLM